MSEVAIAKKAAIVEEVTEKFNAAASAVIVDYLNNYATLMLK